MEPLSLSLPPARGLVTGLLVCDSSERPTTHKFLVIPVFDDVHNEIGDTTTIEKRLERLRGTRPKYRFPGGKVLPGEDVQTASVRVLKAQTRLELVTCLTREHLVHSVSAQGDHWTHYFHITSSPKLIGWNGELRREPILDEPLRAPHPRILMPPIWIEMSELGAKVSVGDEAKAYRCVLERMAGS